MVLQVSFSFERKLLLENIHHVCNNDIIIKWVQFSKILKDVLPYFFSTNFFQKYLCLYCLCMLSRWEKSNCSETEGNTSMHKSSDELLKAENTLKRSQVNPFVNYCINKITTVFKSHVNIRLYEHSVEAFWSSARYANINYHFSEFEVSPRKEDHAW